MRVYRRTVRVSGRVYPQRVYTVDLRAYGGGRVSTGETDRAAATARAEELRAALIARHGIPGRDDRGATCDEGVACWSTSVELHETARWQDDLRVVRSFVGWLGGASRMRAIRVSDFHAWARAERAAVAPATLRRHLSKLSSWYGWCAQRDLVGGVGNPFREVRLPGAGSGRKTGLTRAEAVRVLEAVDGHPQLEPAYWLAIFAGMERGALVLARWEDFDLEAGSLLVRGTKTARRPVDVRHARIPLLEDLRAWHQRQPRPSTGVIVAKSCRRAGARAEYYPDGLQRLRARWNADHPDEAPLPGFHAGRHTIGTWLAAAGVPMYDISRFLRHATSATTERYYAHVSPIERKSSVHGWHVLGDGGNPESIGGHLTRRDARRQAGER